MLTHFTKPEENIARLDLSPGMIAVDIGAGDGYYTLALAKRLRELGEGSIVHAIDVRKDVLERLRAHASEAKVGNVHPIWGDAEMAGGSKLADHSVDLAVVANYFFHVEEKVSFATEVARILKPGGQLLLVDWTESFGNLGPVAERVVTANVAEPYFNDAGLVSKDSFDSGVHHWGLIFTKQ